MNTCPKVFLSSTIYDFRDLRSAIKYWLEQHGYEVRSSDNNDFPQKPNLNSYESCLEAIDDSDYFILLVGGRIGGWYDESAKISITRMEYRRAYEQARQGRLRLLTFVRKDVWDIREDRGALKKFLAGENGKELELSETEQQAITTHPSKFMTDAEAVFDFLHEVGRVQEMKAATKRKGMLPTGNWIHQFVTFRDIADALKAGMRITGTLQRSICAANLRHEIVQNLIKVTQKAEDGAIRRIYSLASSGRSKITGELLGISALTSADMAMFAYMLMIQASVGLRMTTVALHEAVTSGVFLDFDLATNLHVVSLPQQTLLCLLDTIRRLNLGNEQATKLSQEIVAKFRGPGAAYITHEVKNADIMAAAILHDNLHNFTETSVAILNYLTDEDERHLSALETIPVAPVSEFAGGEAIRPSVTEIMTWVSGTNVKSSKATKTPKTSSRGRHAT